MLGRTYRIQVLNSCGQTLASSSITVTARRWNFNSSGTATWEGSETTVWSGNSTITTGSYASSGSVDNSTNAYLGGTFKIAVTTPASASGLITFYLQRSTDGGSTWPDNGNGQVLRVFSVAASTTYTDEVEI